MRQSLREDSIPFETKLKQPNKETIATMLNSEKIAKKPSVKCYHDFDKLFDDIKDERNQIYRQTHHQLQKRLQTNHKSWLEDCEVESCRSIASDERIATRLKL